jgi:hypothetical protein
MILIECDVFNHYFCCHFATFKKSGVKRRQKVPLCQFATLPLCHFATLPLCHFATFIKSGVKRRQKASKGIKRRQKASKGVKRHQKASKGVKRRQNASKLNPPVFDPTLKKMAKKVLNDKLSLFRDFF